MSDTLELSEFQRNVLAVPETFDLCLDGGRGGGKSYTLALLALRHVEQYGHYVRILYLRRSYPGIADFEAITRDLFGRAFGRGATYNATNHTWKFANGATMELGQLEAEGDYQKFQGRSFTLILVDEAAQYPDPAILDRLRSNVRGPKHVPLRFVIAANPGDVGHGWIVARYISRAAPWHPFVTDQTDCTCVRCPSTYRDNPALDGEGYRAQLEASCPTDPELLRAWLDGDWNINRGAFFASVLSEHSRVEPWAHLPIQPDLSHLLPGKRSIVERDYQWRIYLAHDYGSAAPSVTYVCAVSPGAEGPDGRFFPRDSILLLDELATHVPGQLNQGLGWTIPTLADAIKDMAERWGIRPEGVADDACFSNHGHAAGSIAAEFARSGIRFWPAKKGDRIAGWEVMRRLMQDAGKPDKPGLYVSRTCEYFWQTAPYIARDPRRPQDVDSRGPDHGIDCCRYALGWHRPECKVARLVGM